MRANDFAFLGVRLLALYTFIHATSMLPSAISMFLAPPSNSPDPAVNSVMAMGSLSSGLALVVFSGILWAVSGLLADFMTKGMNQQQTTKDELTIQNLYIVGITVLGVYVIASSATNFFSAFGYLLNPGKGEKAEIISALGPVVQMAIGLACAFKPQAVVAKLQRA